MRVLRLLFRGLPNFTRVRQSCYSYVYAVDSDRRTQMCISVRGEGISSQYKMERKDDTYMIKQLVFTNRFVRPRTSSNFVYVSISRVSSVRRYLVRHLLNVLNRSRPFITSRSASPFSANCSARARIRSLIAP
jgi:hypothetical protein